MNYAFSLENTIIMSLCELLSIMVWIVLLQSKIMVLHVVLSVVLFGKIVVLVSN